MGNKIKTGNFNEESEAYRGWIIGHFIKGKPHFQLKDFEVKWGKHKKGDHRDSLSGKDIRSSLCILIYGKELVKFPAENKEILLEKEGDYIFFSPNLPHTWEMLEDSFIIAIRWPSIPTDQKVKKEQ